MNLQSLIHSSALTLALLPEFSVQATDWPQFRGPNRDGGWNETGIMESFPPEGLSVSWRVPVGPGPSAPIPLPRRRPRW